MGLGRLANYSDDLAEALVQNEVLPQLVYSLSEQNRYYKKAAAFCLRAVAKHSPPLAQASTTTCLHMHTNNNKPPKPSSTLFRLGYSCSLVLQLNVQSSAPKPCLAGVWLTVHSKLTTLIITAIQ